MSEPFVIPYFVPDEVYTSPPPSIANREHARQLKQETSAESEPKPVVDGASTSRTSKSNYHWIVFWTVASALIAMVLDFSIVSLALSSIADEFSVTLRAVTWVAIATALTTSALMLPLGRVSDITGRKKFHITGMAIFVAGGILAFTSQNLEMLIASRVVMSIGGAMGQSVVFAIIIGVFPDNQRGKALGMITTAVAIGAAAGPIIAGPVIQEFGWRAVFLVTTVPITLGIVASFVILDDTRIGSMARGVGSKYDWIGAALSASALSLLILTISNPFAYEWGSIEVIGGLVLSAVLFVLLVWWELRTPEPMLNLKFFQNSTFSWSASTRFLGFIGGSAPFFLMPIFVQSFMGYDQRTAGMIMFIGALGMGIASQLAGRYSDIYGFRGFTFAGLGMLIATNIAFSFFVRDTTLWFVLPTLFLNGIAMGLWMAPNMSATLSTVGRGDLGSMSAFLNMVRNVGSVVGQAVTIAIIAGIMLSRDAEVDLSELADAGDEVSSAFLDGWSMAFRVLALISAVALFAAYRTKVYNGDSETTRR